MIVLIVHSIKCLTLKTKSMKSLFKLFLCVAVFSWTLISCDSNDEAAGTSGISVRLVDAPGDYDKVFIDVVGVEAIVDGEPIVLDTNAGVYDLLTLTGGEFVNLVNEEIPSGELSQMRLILGAENTLVLNGGQEVDLQTPSAQQTGLKLNVNYDLQPGVTYEFIMDFNVDKSIVELGNSGHILKPVIQITTSAESGAISGLVSPSGIDALVTATNTTDNTIEVSAHTDNVSGAFLLYGVPEGTYTVVVEPEAESGFTAVTVENVVVETGSTTAIETVVFE